MSLKAFHIVFIAASILLSFFFAAWCFNEYAEQHRRFELVSGIVSVGVGVGLIFYFRYVLKKLKDISYL
jgi:hypothetical protein